MGWFGYGIYEGDETQTCHIDFIKDAEISSDDEEIFGMMRLRKTKIPEESKHLLADNIDFVLKKMPSYKGYFEDDDHAIEWQMLLSLFLDNKIPPPSTVLKNGIEATKYLMGEHAEEFDSPSKRKAALKRFLEKADKWNKKNAVKSVKAKKMKRYATVEYDWKSGGGCEGEYRKALRKFGLVMTVDPFWDGSDGYGYFITEGKISKKEAIEMSRHYHGKKNCEEIGL